MYEVLEPVAVGLVVAASVLYLWRWIVRRLSSFRKIADGAGCGCESRDSSAGPRKGRRAEFIGVIDRDDEARQPR